METSLKNYLKNVFLITVLIGMAPTIATPNSRDMDDQTFNFYLLEQNQHSLKLACDSIKKVLERTMQAIINSSSDDKISQAFFACYRVLQEDNPLFTREDFLQALEYILLEYELSAVSKAPRENAPDNSVVGPLITCDISMVTNLVKLLIKQFNSCCNQLQNDFDETFSLVTDLNESITACTAAIIILDFPSTATVITAIQTTLTTCCQEISDEFRQTWTILVAGFDATSTVLLDIKNTLTACCAASQINFEGTFTLINALGNSQQCPLPSPCSPTPISAPTTISVPGSYCLSADITGPLIINTNDISLDLNGHSITGGAPGSGNGITINPGFNRLIRNGTINSFDTGIQCTNNTDTLLENIIITGCFDEGVTINTGTAIFLDTLDITNIAGIGVHFVNGNDASIVSNVNITQSEQGFVFDFLYNSLIQNCNVLNCSSNIPVASGNIGGFIINNGSFIQIDNCSVKNYTGLQRIAGFSLVNSVENVIFRNCTAQNIVATLTGQISSFALGIIAGSLSSHVEIIQCSAQSINADQIAVGFEIEGDGTTLNKCIAQNCNSNGILADGFHFTSNNVSISYCQAYKCVRNGFNADSLSNSTVLNYCQSSYNSIGFVIQSPATLLDSCVAFKNNAGFNLALAGIAIEHCFATQNLTNYTFFASNVQNSNTQVNNADPALTGPFAGVNLFM